MRWQPFLEIERDPDSDKDWRLELAEWLESGDTISNATVVDSGALTAAPTVEGTDVVLWVSGGTENTRETVTVRVTTSQGRVDDFSLTFLQTPQ